MSSGTDRTDSHSRPSDSSQDDSRTPPRPAFPPRPAVPPRPGVPPMPSSPPPVPGSSPSGGANGSAGKSGSGVGPGGGSGKGSRDDAERPAGHTEKDEPTRTMPHDTEPDATARPRLPAPSETPQPPPPTGQPLTAETLRRRPRPTGRDGSAPSPSALPSQGASGQGPYRPDGAHDTGPSTAELRPVRETSGHSGPAPRTVAAAVCLVLGVGLLGGAAAGMTWLTDDPEQGGTGQPFDQARSMWHSEPVDELFPRELKGAGAGPGGADRRWLRVSVAPDSDCRNAFDPLLAKALSPVGCSRLLRATYADETTSSVTTVGLVFTRSDAQGMRSLRKRFAVENLSERTDLMPRPYPARGTVAADFGDAQRASWTVRVLSDTPVVVYAVTGFADGRVVSDPQAAAEATEKGETSAAAQAGLGHDAQGIADRIERRLRDTSAGRGEGDK